MTDDWTEGEREAAVAEIARREAEIRRDEVLRRCEQRIAAFKTAPIAKSAAAIRKTNDNDMSTAWTDYIAREIRTAETRTIEACMSAAGEVLAEQGKKLRAEFELEIAKLRAEFLQSELDRERGTRLKLVSPAGMIA